MKRSLLQLICILLLLMAQHGALTHAVWHANAQQPAHHDHAHEGAGGGQSPESSLCGFDLAFGQVMGGVHAAGWHLVLSEFDAERIAHLPYSRIAAATPVARSRGPPSLS